MLYEQYFAYIKNKKLNKYSFKEYVAYTVYLGHYNIFNHNSKNKGVLFSNFLSLLSIYSNEDKRKLSEVNYFINF